MDICINNLPSSPFVSSSLVPPPSILFVSSKITQLPSQHLPHRYHSRAFLTRCFHNDTYDRSTDWHRSDRTSVSSWICSASIGCDLLWVWSVKKPGRLPPNLGLGQGDELCGGARGCVQEREICIAGNTLGVPSEKEGEINRQSFLAEQNQPTSPTSFVSHIS